MRSFKIFVLFFFNWYFCPLHWDVFLGVALWGFRYKFDKNSLPFHLPWQRLFYRLHIAHFEISHSDQDLKHRFGRISPQLSIYDRIWIECYSLCLVSSSTRRGLAFTSMDVNSSTWLCQERGLSEHNLLAAWGHQLSLCVYHWCQLCICWVESSQGLEHRAVFDLWEELCSSPNTVCR